MTTPTTTDLAPRAEMSAEVLETVLLQGDLARLKPEGRIQYMTRVCETLGLNPLTKPFEFISLNNKLVMYAKKDCTEQLRRIHGVSLTIVSREVIEGVYVVTARAQDKTGRHDESTGAVSIDGLKGESRANALMKAETKAKRRVTLSICGLGVLDESEVDSIPGAQPVYEAPRERYAPPGGASQQPPKGHTPSSSNTPTTSPAIGDRLATPIGHAEAAQTATQPHSSTASVASPKRPRADQVKHDGTFASPGQVKLLHTLATKLEIACDGNCAVPTKKFSKKAGLVDATTVCKYHQGVAAFRDCDGNRITSSKDLSERQISILIDRMQAGIERKEGRTVRPIDLGDLGPVDPSEALAAATNEATKDAGEYADLVRDVTAIFGVDEYGELTTEQKAQALQLVLVAHDPEKWRRVKDGIQGNSLPF